MQMTTPAMLAICVGCVMSTAVLAADSHIVLPRVCYGDPNGHDTKDPSVVRFKGRYYLYYSVWGGPGKPWLVGVASSDNLRDWKYVDTLRPRTAAEQHGFCAPGARVIDGRVHLFYQSYGAGAKDAILHAVSDDGVHFERDKNARHVFRPTGDWNNGRAIDAEAYPIGDKLMLYYATRDPAGRVQMIGVASAPLAGGDYGMGRWTQLSTDASLAIRPTVPTPLDPPGLDLAWEQQCVEAPTLLPHGGRHYLFYAGAYNNAPQQIGVAVSGDGVRFTRLNGDRPLLPPGPPGSWNAGESGHPGSFHDDDGRDYLFFQGDNPKAGVKWHISMVPIRWQPDPTGGPDVPTLDLHDPILK